MEESTNENVNYITTENGVVRRFISNQDYRSVLDFLDSFDLILDVLDEYHERYRICMFNRMGYKVIGDPLTKIRPEKVKMVRTKNIEQALLKEEYNDMYLQDRTSMRLYFPSLNHKFIKPAIKSL